MQFTLKHMFALTTIVAVGAGVIFSLQRLRSHRGGDGFMLTAFSAWIGLVLLAAGLVWIISRFAARR
jgi:hypothetical protein